MVISGECTYIRLKYLCLEARIAGFEIEMQLPNPRGDWVRTVDETVVNICMFHTNTQIDLDVWK